jgi:hypothetical protein
MCAIAVFVLPTKHVIQRFPEERVALLLMLLFVCFVVPRKDDIIQKYSNLS